MREPPGAASGTARPPVAAGAPDPRVAAATRNRHANAFLAAFVLANVGGVIGYLPLLTLMLPLRIEAVAGPARMGVAAVATVAGAAAASIGAIAFGWLSDRSVARGGGRRGWIAGGLAALPFGYALLALAATPGAIVAAVAVFQLLLNVVLAPLAAILADEVPDARKGLVGGLTTLSGPVASAVGVGLMMVPGGAIADGAGDAVRHAIVPVLVAGCVLPLVLMRPRPVVGAPIPPAGPARSRAGRRGDLVAMAGARLLVQVAGTAVFAWLLYFAESVAPGVPRATLALRVARLSTLAYLAAVPVALLVGRWSDRRGRRVPFLLATAGAATLGLVLMALAHRWAVAAAGFALFAVGVPVFLSLQNAFAAQVLPDPRRHGRDMGLLNLGHTIPAMIGAGLVWWLATPHSFAPLMLALAALTACGGGAALLVRGWR